MSGYLLAIDFGTSSTAAVIADEQGVEVVEIGGVARVPSTVAALEDDTLVAGEAALRQLAVAPDRVERAPKRRLGDRAVLLGERPVAPTALAAAVLRLVADEAARRRGGAAPTSVRLTHPASWASTRLEALAQAAAQAGLPRPDFLPEPVAAALHLSGGHLDPGATVAVYDLGGGTFDAAVLRRTESGFTLAGPPGGNDRVGGEDLDEKLLEHVGASIREQDAEAWERLRFSDERPWRRAAAALRAEVRGAKEALSSASSATLYVPAPVDLEVRVTREELEVLARADLERTVDELMATVERSGVALTELSAVYLVGGASRMPLVGRLVAERTGIVPTTWGDPKAVVALGAASAPSTALTRSDDQHTTVLPVVTLPTQAPPQEVPVAATAAAAAPAAALSPGASTTPSYDVPVTVPAVPRPPVGVSPVVTPPVDEPVGPARRGRSRLFVGAAAAVALVLVGTGVVLASGGEESKRQVAAAAPVEVAAYTFALSGDASVRSQRTWALDETGMTLRSSTLLTNPGAKPVTRTALEVVPKEVARTVADVDFEPGFTVVQDDPVVRYDVVLAPGASRTIVWSAALPSRTDSVGLAALASAQRTAEKAFAPLLRRLVPAAVLARAPVVPFSLDPDPGPTTSSSRQPSIAPSSGAPATPGPGQPPLVIGPTGRTSGPDATGGPIVVDPIRTSAPPVVRPSSSSPRPAASSAPALKAPGAPSSGSARFNSVTARVSGRQDVSEVSLTVSWGAPSSGGAVSSYEVRRFAVNSSGTRTLQSRHSASGTSLTLNVPACNLGGGRWSWEVVARNAAGTSGATALSARIIDMNGELGFDGTQMIRTAGAIVAYEGHGGDDPPPSSDQKYRVYFQSPTGGTLIQGSTVRLYYYGE